MPETLVATGAVNFIAGEWLRSQSGRTYERHNSWRPTEVVGDFPCSDTKDVASAVSAAEGAARRRVKLPAPKRGTHLAAAADALERRAEEIAQDMTREMGKPLRESRMEAARTAAIFRFFSGEGWRPLGQVYEQSLTGAPRVHAPAGARCRRLITPWSFPAAIRAWKMAPPLAYGNAVVLKLAQDA